MAHGLLAGPERSAAAVEARFERVGRIPLSVLFVVERFVRAGSSSLLAGAEAEAVSAAKSRLFAAVGMTVVAEPVAVVAAAFVATAVSAALTKRNPMSRTMRHGSAGWPVSLLSFWWWS